MKFTGAVWLLTVVLILSACKNKTEKNLPNADTLSSQELSDPQIRALTERVNADPNNPENYFLRSGAFLQANNIRAAFKDLSMAIALDSSNLKYYFAMADLSLKGGSAPAAILAFNQVLHREPNNMEALIKLSKVYFYDKDYSNSLIQLSKAEEADKSNPEIWFVRGLNLKEMGDTTRAIIAFQRAVAMKTDFYDAYIQLGLIHMKKPGDLASKYFDNAIRLDSMSEEAYYDKARFYQDRGDAAFAGEQFEASDANYELAKAAYRQLVTVNPQYENAYFNLGFIFLRQDSLDAAYRMFDFAIKANPQYAEAYYYRGLVSLEKGNKEPAMADFRQALILKPDYELAKKELGQSSEKN